MLQKREKVLLLRTFQGRTLRIVREHYLRPSVPCNSPLCTQPAACRNGQGLGGSEGGRGGDEEPRGRVRGEPWTPGSKGGGAGVVRPLRRKGATGGAARGLRGAESKAPGPPLLPAITFVSAVETAVGRCVRGLSARDLRYCCAP